MLRICRLPWFARLFRTGHILLAAAIWLDVAGYSVANADEPHGDAPNLVSVFIGNTQRGSSNGASLGLEYERRLSTLIGLGAFAEYAGGDIDAVRIGVPVFFHPHAGWVFKLAPGTEIEHADAQFMMRAGVENEFEVASRWILIPQINADFIDRRGTMLIYGLSVSRQF